VYFNAWILIGFFIEHHLHFLYLLGFLNAFFITNSLLLTLFISVHLSYQHPFFLLPRFRIQYSLNVADRLADEHVLIGLYVNRLRNNPSCMLESSNRLDEEHRLIARYAARLAAESTSSQPTQQRSAPDISFTIDANKQQRQLIAELENKNR